jgi:hypothetical protein
MVQAGLWPMSPGSFRGLRENRMREDQIANRPPRRLSRKAIGLFPVGHQFDDISNVLPPSLELVESCEVMRGKELSRAKIRITRQVFQHTDRHSIYQQELGQLVAAMPARIDPTQSSTILP